MDCDIKITLCTILDWIGLDCTHACIWRCFESELQDKDPSRIRRLGIGYLFIFSPSLLPSICLHDAMFKHRSGAPAPHPRPRPIPHFHLPLPVGTPQPGMMRQGTAEAKVRPRPTR